MNDNTIEIFMPKLPRPIICDIEDMHKLMDIRNQVHVEGKRKDGGGGSLRVHYETKGLVSLTSISHIIMFGRRRNDVYIDHADRDIYNNTRKNLRVCSSSQNQQNKPKTTKKTSSRFLGVNKFKNKWQARITVNGDRRFVGSFDVEEDAARARDKAARKYYKEFAVLNFPITQVEKGATKDATTGNQSTGDATNEQGHV